jgi:hypothetical protein
MSAALGIFGVVGFAAFGGFVSCLMWAVREGLVR